MFPPLAASFCSTVLCSQMFIWAESPILSAGHRVPWRALCARARRSRLPTTSTTSMVGATVGAAFWAVAGCEGGAASDDLAALHSRLMMLLSTRMLSRAPDQVGRKTGNSAKKGDGEPLQDAFVGSACVRCDQTNKRSGGGSRELRGFCGGLGGVLGFPLGTGGPAHRPYTRPRCP